MTTRRIPRLFRLLMETARHTNAMALLSAIGWRGWYDRQQLWHVQKPAGQCDQAQDNSSNRDEAIDRFKSVSDTILRTALGLAAHNRPPMPGHHTFLAQDARESFH